MASASIAELLARQQLSNIPMPIEFDTRAVDEGVIRPPTPYESVMFWAAKDPALESMVSGAGEMLGIMPSMRLTDRLRSYMSPVTRPQTTLGWASSIAEAGKDVADMAMSALDVFGLGKIAAPAISQIGRRAGKYLTDEAGMVGAVLPKGLAPRTDVGSFDTQRLLREHFGENLGDDSQKFLRWVERSRNKSAIHPNKKTGLSLDFSTNCCQREGKHGPCLYCYVDQVRAADDAGLKTTTNPKRIVETPYQREILGMPAEIIDELNRDGGLRMFSFGDYRPRDAQQIATALDDARAKGLWVKAITKQREFVERFGDQPNLRINISVDALPRDISNAPTIEEAMQWKAGRDNIKIRAVALNPEEAEMFAKDPRIDVVTLYHGSTGERLERIVEVQNKNLFEAVGEQRIKKDFIERAVNMPPNSREFRRLAEKYPNKICCQGQKCSRDRTKCGFGLGGLIPGVAYYGEDEAGAEE